MSPNGTNILDQIGFAGLDRNADGGSDDVATNALLHLVESGSVSVEVAKAAVQSARSKRGDSGQGDSKVSSDNIKKKNHGKGGADKAKPLEKYRTRHVALQFAYDGTDFTGFAQNIGKDYDNSVEKT